MRVTGRGIGLCVAAAVLLAAGFTFGYAELSLLGAAAAGAVGCAVGHAAWRPRLDVTRRVDPDRVGRGEPARVSLTLRNRGRLRSASLLAEDRCGGRPVPVPVPVLRLRPGRDSTVEYPVPTHRRGVVTVGPLRVTGRDALGLVSLARAHGESAEIWVHPRIHPLSAVPVGVARSLDGRVDRVPHGSITFDSLREYVVGDELRRVHWRTSAKVGELMVREHVDTSLPRLVVLLDNRAGAHPVRPGGVAETFESACEAAASVVAAARREDLPVSLLLVVADGAGRGGDGAGRRRDGADNYLDRLAEVELRPDGDGGDATPGGGGSALRTAATRLRQERLGDTLVFLTGPGARGDLGYLGALRGTYPSVIAGVCDDTGGRSPAATGGMVVIDAVDGAAFAAEWDGIQRW